MRMRHLIFFLCLLGVVRAADIIPAAARPGFVPGTDTGVIGGIPTTFTDVYLPSGGSYTLASTGDSTDRTAEIQALIDNAGSENKVILLGPGNFTIAGRLYFSHDGQLYHNRVLRGSGVNSTSLLFTTATNGCFIFGPSGNEASSEAAAETISANAAKGDTQIVFSSATSFVAGDLIMLFQNNIDSSVTTDRVEFSVSHNNTRGWSRQLVRVEEVVNSTTLRIFPPLYKALVASRTPKAFAYAGGNIRNCGLEDLTLDMSNRTSNTVCITMFQAYGCWINNVKLIPGTANYGVHVDRSLNSEIRRMEFTASPNTGTNGAGFLIERSAALLVEDNIMRHFNPHVEINFGTSGSSISYNYFENTDVNSVRLGASINVNHGQHNSHQLIEGNRATIIQSDGYFGSASDNFIVRNSFHGTNEEGATTEAQTEFSVVVNLNRFTRHFYIVGNILGVPQSWWTSKIGFTMAYRPTSGWGAQTPVIFSFGYPEIGGGGYDGDRASLIGANPWTDWPTLAGPNGYLEMDDDVVATTTYKGNWNGVDSGIAAGEALGSDTISNSYAYASKPAWFGSLAWPPYDAATYTFTTLNADAVKIPAGWRAINGNENYLSGGAAANATINQLNADTLHIP